MSQYPVPTVNSNRVAKTSVKDSDKDDTDEISPLQMRQMIRHKDGKFYYGVNILTGSQLLAGTKGNAYVSLVGEKGQTGQVEIDDIWEKFAGQQGAWKETSEVVIIETAQDLGDVLVVTVGIKPLLLMPDDWYVSTVTVVNMQNDKTEKFPCYRWISVGTEVSATANTTTKKNVEGSAVLEQQRNEQLRKKKEQYQWLKFPDWGIPSGIDDTVQNLPSDEQFGAVKNVDFFGGALEAFVGLGKRFATLQGAELFISVDELSQYEQYATTQGGATPLFQASRWTTDVEFGRQMLNGVNPIIIERCDKLPDKFPVTEEMVAPFLVRGVSLQQEMKDGNVYICDLKMMDDLPTKDDHYNCAPICLLYVNRAKQLVPIAIQLLQGVREEEKVNNPIFLPTDNYIDWLRAKIYYRSAHSQLHQLLTHYNSCHATMEAYSMGIHRNLPEAHPIFKLLRPFVRYTMAINSRARVSLINDNGAIPAIFGIGADGKNELFRRIGQSYDVNIANIKKFAEKRGVADADKLPGYYYRDDGFKVWDALEGYAGDVIKEFFQSDDDVKGDVELQAFAQDLHTNGFPGFGKVPDGHGFPNSINTREELRELCTLIMFTGSAQHAAVNFQQYFIYQYVPNAPFGVRLPVPAKKGEADYETLLESLPDEMSTILGVGLTHLLSQYSTNEKLLGDFTPRFTEVKAIRCIERFQTKLEGISGDILERNKELDMPYIGLLPEKVPNSITI